MDDAVIKLDRQCHASPLRAQEPAAFAVPASFLFGLAFVEQLRGRFGPLVYDTMIRENVRLAECPSFCQSIDRYDPFCAGAVDYRKLASDVIRQENGHMA
jgi:hypothetical protein